MKKKKPAPSKSLLERLAKVTAVTAFPRPAPVDRLPEVVGLPNQSQLRAEHSARYKKPKKNYEASVVRLPPELMRELRCASFSVRVSQAKIIQDALEKHLARVKDEHISLGGQWIEPPPKNQNRS